VSYNLHLTDIAEESLIELMDTLVPEKVHRAVYDEIERLLLELAKDPIRRFVHGPEGRPTSIISFSTEGTFYYWGVTLHFAEDEQTLILTEFIRLRMIL
jgi:hypothetical protein